MAEPVVLDLGRRALLDRRARRLAWVTIGYNTAEGVVAVAAGAAAGSVALVGFGLDSAVEVLSAIAISWQFSGRGDAQRREGAALRLIAVSFFLLAAYVGTDAVRSLTTAGEASSSGLGIALALASLLVMPLLVRLKRRVGQELGSASVQADATQTELCTYLSAVLLVGLVLNASLGWSWADPVVGLVIAAVAAREGVQAWRGDACCAPAASAGDPAAVCCEPVGCACPAGG